jgi:hypothetical protein
LEKDSANGGEAGDFARGTAEPTVPTWPYLPGDLDIQKEKTAGAVPAVWDEFAAWLPLTALVAFRLFATVDRFLEFGPWSKFCYLASGDFDGGARLRVAPVAGLSLGYRECAKTNQGYPISLLQGRGNTVHCSINRMRSLRFANFAGSCDPVNEIGFIHFLSWQVP